MRALLLAAVLASPASSASFVIDPQHSALLFTVKHVAGRLRGSFNTLTGVIEFDEKRPASCKFEVEAHADAIDTGSRARDSRLKGPEFLAAAENPRLAFESRSIKAAGPWRYEASGGLLLRGLTRPATISVEYLGWTRDPNGMVRAGFTAKGTLHRKDFGMAFPPDFPLGDEIAFTAEIEAVDRAAMERKAGVKPGPK
jgi:polyisoprenoid-binding protein YceI